MAGFKRRLLAEDDANARATALADLAAERRDVFCRCNRCGYNVLMGAADLIAQFGPDFPVPEIGGRLRCAGCGAKDVATRANRPAAVAAPPATDAGAAESPWPAR